MGGLFFYVLFSRARGRYLCAKQRVTNMISQESDEVKLLFIEEALSLHGEWLCDILVEAIEKNKLRRTDTLLDSINYSGFTDNGNPGLRFSFFGYGRAVDMAGYKRNKHEVDTMHDIWGMKRNKLKRTSNRWYAKNMYAGYYKLVSKIMYGLGEQEIARLKGILENRKNATI